MDDALGTLGFRLHADPPPGPAPLEDRRPDCGDHIKLGARVPAVVWFHERLPNGALCIRGWCANCNPMKVAVEK